MSYIINSPQKLKGLSTSRISLLSRFSWWRYIWIVWAKKRRAWLTKKLLKQHHVKPNQLPARKTSALSYLDSNILGLVEAVHSWSSWNRIEHCRHWYTRGFGSMFPRKCWNLASLKYTFGAFSERMKKWTETYSENCMYLAANRQLLLS